MEAPTGRDWFVIPWVEKLSRQFVPGNCCSRSHSGTLESRRLTILRIYPSISTRLDGSIWFAVVNFCASMDRRFNFNSDNSKDAAVLASLLVCLGWEWTWLLDDELIKGLRGEVPGVVKAAQMETWTVHTMKNTRRKHRIFSFLAVLVVRLTVSCFSVVLGPRALYDEW